MPSKKSSDSASDSDLRFEDAVERLEEIIGRMESEQIPLDDLLKDYEEGTKLLAQCRQRIDGARSRVEKINKDLAKASPEHDTSDGDGDSDTLDDDDDDEISLL